MPPLVGELNMTPGDADYATAFAKIDADGNGSISKEELWEHLCGKVAAALSESDFDVLFRLIDADVSVRSDTSLNCKCEHVTCVRALTTYANLVSCRETAALTSTNTRASWRVSRTNWVWGDVRVRAP